MSRKSKGTVTEAVSLVQRLFVLVSPCKPLEWEREYTKRGPTLQTSRAYASGCIVDLCDYMLTVWHLGSMLVSIEGLLQDKQAPRASAQARSGAPTCLCQQPFTRLGGRHAVVGSHDIRDQTRRTHRVFIFTCQPSPQSVCCICPHDLCALTSPHLSLTRGNVHAGSDSSLV